MGGLVPAFPEENVVARVEGGPEEPVQAETPVPAAPAPSRSQIPGVAPEPSGPVAPPPAPAPTRPEPPAAEPEPPAPVGAPADSDVPDGGDGAGQSGDGEATGGNGDAQPERPELSEASAAALRRAREQSGGRKKRKHGRNR